MAAARATRQRIEDSQKMLARGGDAWLATADDRGPHLVPLSLAWDQQNGVIIFCTEGQNKTSRNITDRPSVRVAVGSTRDVLMVYGTANVIGSVGDHPRVAEIFASNTGWNPSANTGNWVFITIVPQRMQAWREVNEISGRTIMKGGEWL